MAIRLPVWQVQCKFNGNISDEPAMHIYRFLSGDDDSEFCHKVTKALTEGWVLYGSSHYVFDPAADKMRCGQAVTKEVDDQPYDPDKKLTEYE